MTIPNSLSYNFNYSVYPSGSVDQYYRHSGHKTSRLLTLKNKKILQTNPTSSLNLLFLRNQSSQENWQDSVGKLQDWACQRWTPGLPRNVPLDAVLRVLGCLTRPEVVQVTESRVGEGRVTGSAGRARGQRENPDKAGLGDGRPQGSESALVILWGRHGFLGVQVDEHCAVGVSLINNKPIVPNYIGITFFFI